MNECAAALLACSMLACGSRSGLLGDESAAAEPGELAAAPPPLGAAPDFSLPLPEPEPLRGCVDITRSYTSVPASVLLLIDQSGSMTARFGFGTRWDVLRDAIVDPDDGLLVWLDQGADIGLMLYTSLNGFENGRSCPLLTSVQVAFGNAERVREVYLASEPVFDGDTPTAEAIDSAVQHLLGVAPDAPKHILLLTDGIPDTCAVPDPQNGLQAAIDAAQRAFARGVRVHTVGVSDDIARWPLQWMANAGAGKPARELVFGRDPEAEEPLSASTDPRLLAAQLRGIIGDVRTCSIELGESVGPGRAFDGRLVLDGVVLEYGASDGWAFVDDDTIEIQGASCESILSDGERLQVRFPCVPERSPR